MKSKTLLRVIVLALVSLVLMLIGKHSPLSVYFSLDGLTEIILASGAYGIVLFIIAYTVGTLMNIPGVIFLFIGFMVYKGFAGIAIGFIATIIAMVVHFFFVRLMAGEALAEIKQPFIKKQMLKLTEHPIRTTVVLRLILFVSPPVNYALALSSIRFKDFILGSVIALPANIMLNYFLMAVAKDQMLRWFG